MQQYFLAANSKDGFHSEFRELSTYPEIKKIYIIKGTAGSGKSTFMKKLGAYLLDNGYDAEYIYCSSDAESLDCLISRKAGFAICDGTAPHVTEPIYACAFETYLNFTEFMDADELNVPKIRELIDQISELYSTVYNYLSIAGTYQSELLNLGISSEYIDKAKKRAKGICSRELSFTENEGVSFTRLLSGISPQGYVTFIDTLTEKADKIYTIDDTYGLSHFMLTEILDTALLRGYTVYKFLSPLNTKKIEHLYIAELALAFVTNSTLFTSEIDGYRNIVLDNYVELEQDDKKNAKFLQNSIELNVNKAIDTMKICKALHDDLEELYISCMDFDGLDKFFDQIISKI